MVVRKLLRAVAARLVQETIGREILPRFFSMIQTLLIYWLYEEAVN